MTIAWDVEEETGLNGAQVLAKTLKPDYVFAVDTFVSSDTPLENKRFGDAVLGKGAVLRSIDTSNITPKTEIRKLAKLAASRGIPIQICSSRGGNDGSVFVTDGAVDIPLSWPGVHAHSFIEKIDRNLKDKGTDTVVVDASGHMVAPGLIDMQAFVGEPGAEHRETIASATMAAAAGGMRRQRLRERPIRRL